MTRRLAFCLIAIAPLLGACRNVQSALDPHGPAARELSMLTWWLTGIATLIWLLVVLWLVLALRRPATAEADIERRRSGMTRTVTGLVVGTALIVGGLTVVSFLTTRAISRTASDPLVITVRGQQWWWQFLYRTSSGQTFETANEMHIPIGRDVLLHLESPDVVHSFWVPSLAGKQDLVPGRRNILTIRAEKAGVYRGQCAEFCGLQHSHMSLFVIAEPPADYDRWASRQHADAAEPDDPALAAGRAVFLGKQCAACHTIRGTSATGKTGPDLTHVGGRRNIAAGVLENTRGAMAAWIADPQTIKPGNNMPAVMLSSEELRQVSAYMESLK